MDKELEQALRRIEQLEAQNEELTRQLLRRNIIGGGFYRDRFLVKSTLGDRIVPVEDIRYVFSDSKCTHVCLVDGASYVLDMTLEYIENELNPVLFTRANRKYLVPKIQILSLENDINGKGRLILKGKDAPEIMVSRTRKAEIKKWLDGHERHDPPFMIINPQD